MGVRAACVITALLHPFGYAKVLMKVGHEPLAPESTTTFLFRKDVYVYPNIFKYLGHIKKLDGFTGLYRGVVPRILAGTIGNLVQYNIQDRIKLHEKKPKKWKDELSILDGDDEEFVPRLKQFAKETSEDTLGRCCGVIVSHLFHVIMIRSMVQFIGRETQYNSIWSSTKEIYNHDGILGFFSGLVPRLIGEIIAIWVTSFLAKVINKYLIQENDLKSYTGAACGLVVSHFTYHFTLVTNVMAVNGSGLAAGSYPNMPLYNNWWDCMRYLSSEGDLKRGANAFWRMYKPKPTVLTKMRPKPTVLSRKVK
ncbi:mitochondrial carrier homolog 2-like [Physella acuta]|uniref:mitochondrial carrier homolog 2-like n=1 Tax=Physella acuta TaxID=109671 RepID=UPI0027DD6E33|nr:mitochondrial carrier homolog 2-like [Physella acuta]